MPGLSAAGCGSALEACARALEPSGRLFGMDGAILLAFLLGLSANETVLPILLMIYTAGGSLSEPGTLASVRESLLQNGWTTTTAVCATVFTVLHWPCSTTLLTIKKRPAAGAGRSWPPCCPQPSVSCSAR